MLTCPRTASTPYAPKYRVYRTGYTPDVRVMVCHPSSCPIHNPCCFASRLRHIFNHAKKGLMQLREVCLFRRPVVHLSVDVDGVFAVPRRAHVRIPEPLKIGWLATRL